MAGLYDLCGKQFYRIQYDGDFYDGKVSGATRAGETFQVPPTVVYGRRDGRINATISCKAAGAHSYKWYRNGVLVDGATDDTLTVDWDASLAGGNVMYSVKPVYEVFKETVTGEEASATVTLLTAGLMTIFK